MEQVKEPVKEDREEQHVVAIACRIMAGVSPIAATSVNSQSQPPFPTPSPFSFSGTSTRWSSRPSVHHSNLGLRFLVLIFSFISALTLAAPSTNKKHQPSLTFTEYPELMWVLINYNFASVTWPYYKGKIQNWLSNFVICYELAFKLSICLYWVHIL